MKTKGNLLVGLAVLALVAPRAASALDSKVIYGTDDRLNYYEASANEQLAARSTAAVVSSIDLSTSDGGLTYNLPGGTAGLCSTEPFYTEPAPAFCSAFKVADDMVVTAGHCVNAGAGGSCAGTSFVFDFRMDGPGDTPNLGIPAADVYDCVDIVGKELGGADLSDWSLLRVDRPITGGRANLAYRTAAMSNIPSNEPITVIGYPIGLPVKISNNAVVKLNGQAAYFSSNLDTYGGNSGSSVFNTASIAAMVKHYAEDTVRGSNDFSQTFPCRISNVCPDTGCPGFEDVTRAKEFENCLDSGTDCGQAAPPSCSPVAAAGTAGGALPYALTALAVTVGGLRRRRR
ncbi:MAG: trypsin-like peptidase domain-containing protein [Myxococcales bacterium]|nr:trypsin-like peptidase domain-containing protein [Myxococcales bacterium]